MRRRGIRSRLARRDTGNGRLGGRHAVLTSESRAKDYPPRVVRLLDGIKAKFGDDSIEWIAAWAIGVVSLLHLVYYAPRIVDHAFISLRFAENLANGHGAVFNAGERVEGYSGPSWMLLQALGLRVGFEGVTWTKLLGGSCFLALQVGFYRMARQMFGIEPYLALVGTLVLALNSYVVDWAMLGLETPLHLAMLVWCPLAIQTVLEKPRKRTRLLAIASLIALATTRPESMLYVLICLASPILGGRSIRDRIRVARRLLRVALPAAVVIAALLAVRYGYYGRLLPQTYYAKGAAVTFDEKRLLPLVMQGVTLPETIMWLGGALLLIGFGWRKRAWAPVLMMVACAYFTASVTLDWMPNLRHLLPITLFAPLGWLAFAQAMINKRRVQEYLGWASIALLGIAAQYSAQVDSRVSPMEVVKEKWARPKTWLLWKGSIGAFSHRPSVAVAQMNTYDMGQISQAWGVLEASREPLEESWFLGRDIGAIAYYTGCKVFDTEALFTPAVSNSKPWRDHRDVDDPLILQAIAKKPVAAEVYDAWALALGRHEGFVARYRLRFGATGAPNAIIAQVSPPDREEVLHRYRDFAGKFPKLFYLHTLYGEAVGEAVLKRQAAVRALPPDAFDAGP